VTGTSAYIGDSLQATDVNTEKDISYGPVGNVTALTRCGSDGTPVSQMSMNYSGSRLNSVSDAVSGQSWTRSYKDDGALYYEGKTDRYYTDNIIGMTAKVYSDEPFLNYDYTPVATYIYLPDGTKVEARNINFAANTLYRGSFIYSKAFNSPASLKSIMLPGMVVSVSGSTWTPLAFVTDHLDNVRAVVDMQSATVVERNDYYPYGGRITQPSDTSAAYPSASANRWRHAGKEEQDSVTGLPISDFGARMYDPFTATWLTQDPMATDYPDFGPYVFCAGNPVNLVDRDGGRIIIKFIDERGSEQSLSYHASMEYKGSNGFVSNVVMALNAIYASGGEKLIKTLVDANQIYSYTNLSPLAENIGYISTPSGGSISLDNLSNTYQTESDWIEGVAHESFHAIQDYEGQGGTSIFNEIEAYVFSFIITNQWLSSDLYTSPQSIPIGNMGSREYTNAINEISTNCDKEAMKVALKLFKTDSYANSSGIYSNFPYRRDNTTRFILKKYFPVMP
jgi:RHS repeat-associated protein